MPNESAVGIDEPFLFRAANLSLESALDEREQVGIYGVRLRGWHTVRKTLVGFQRPVL